MPLSLFVDKRLDRENKITLTIYSATEMSSGNSC